MAYSSTNETDPMTDLRTRLLRSITKMLGEQNGYAPESYTWVWERWGQAPLHEVVAMQNGWMVNHPGLHARHGIYVM
jgi:hypothetical protein